MQCARTTQFDGHSADFQVNISHPSSHADYQIVSTDDRAQHWFKNEWTLLAHQEVPKVIYGDNDWVE